METSTISNKSLDFIGFSDSDSSPVITKNECQSTSKQYNKKNSGHYKHNNYQNRSWNKRYNSSPDSPSTPNQYSRHHNNRNKFYNKYQQGNFNRNRYVHPSFLEDPWADLIRQQDESNNETSITENDSTNKLQETETENI